MPTVVTEASLSGGGHPDAGLLRLGVEFVAAWNLEKAEWAALPPDALDEDCASVNAAAAITKEIVGRLRLLPATTLTGLRIKAMAFCWCRGEGWITDEIIEEEWTTDWRVALSLIRDILDTEA
jgi:hypothetical protein